MPDRDGSAAPAPPPGSGHERPYGSPQSPRPVGPEDPAVKKWSVRFAQVALTVAVTWFILDRVGIDLAALRGQDLGEWRPNPFTLTASCLVLLSGYLVSAALWGLIVRDLGGPALPARTSMRLFLVANLGRYVPGKIWQIAGLAYLAKREGVSGGIATGAAVVGQGMAILAASLLGAGMLLGPEDWWRRLGWMGLAGGIAIAVAATGLVTVPSFFWRAVGLWCRVTHTDPPGSPRRHVGVRWLALYVVNWSLYTVAFWLLYLSFGEWKAFMQVGPAFALAYVAGYAAVFAPAGAGIREGFLVLLLRSVMGEEAALVFALIARVWATAVELLPAAIFALVHTRSSRDTPTVS